MLNPNLDAALSELANLSPQEALSVLEALDKKRHEQHFAKYWLPYESGNQKDIFSRFTRDIKVMLVLGGNRSGKTEPGAWIANAWCLGKDYFRAEPAWEIVKDLPIPDPPNNVWVVGLDFPTVRDVIWREKLRMGRTHPAFVPAMAFPNPWIRKVNEADLQIFYANGSVLSCKSADSGREKFQGASVDLVWIDEEPEVEIYDECYQRTSDCAGKLLITLTPLTDIGSGVRTPWVFDLFQEHKGGRKDIDSVTLSVLDNPYVPDDEKDKLKVKWSGHYEEQARLYGKFIQRSGLVYREFDAKKHLIKPFALNRSWRRIACVDPAATGVTACLWCAVAPNGDLYFYREYYERDLVVSEHARNLRVLSGNDQVDIWLIDPKWGTQRNAETHKTNQQLYKDAGIPVRLANVGEDYGLNASREYITATATPGIPHAKAYFFNDLGHFKFEMEHYVWDFFMQGEQKGLSKDKPRKRHDHLMNAFQYICAMQPRGRIGAVHSDPRINSYTSDVDVALPRQVTMEDPDKQWKELWR